MDEKIIRGSTLSTPMKRPDMAQTDERKSDYILNNPLAGTSEADNGKVLVVKDGKPAFTSIVQVGYGDMNPEASIQILGTDEEFEDGPNFVTFQNGSNITLESETEYRSESDITSLSLAFPNDMAMHFMCSLEFDTSATASVNISGSHYITGDACVGGVFTPKGSMHYSILLWYDGSRVQGVARGVAL